jgi:HAMP domain
MKISQISKSIIFAFSAIFIVFGISVSYALNHLNRSFLTVSFFDHEKDKIFVEVTQPILNYLLTGEATLLSKIENNLMHISQEVEQNNQLSTTLKTPFLSLLQELKQSTLSELTAAGKLADPQVLLINNEKQLSQYLITLQRYADRAPKQQASAKNKYYLTLSHAEASLFELSRARHNYFTAKRSISSEIVEKKLQALIDATQAVKQLPLLGLMTEKSAGDESSLVAPQHTALQEDMALEPIRQIASLVQSYWKDFETASQTTQRKIEGQNQIHDQILLLQNKLISLENETTKEYQLYEQLMFIVIGICSLLFLITLILFFAAGQKVLRKIFSLEYTMTTIAETGDLSLRAKSGGNDELASMADAFNSMAEQLHLASQLIKKKVNDIQTILQNMPQGLLSITSNNKVSPEYSAHLENILETSDIAGRDYCALLFSGSNLDSEQI